MYQNFKNTSPASQFIHKQRGRLEQTLRMNQQNMNIATINHPKSTGATKHLQQTVSYNFNDSIAQLSVNFFFFLKNENYKTDIKMPF